MISATLMVLLYFQAALYTPPFYKQRQFEESIGGRLQHIIEQNAPPSDDPGAVARHLSAGGR